MSTRSIVGIPLDNGFKGRYVHGGGYPTCMTVTLLALVKREGVERVRQVVTEENYGWSMLDEDTTEDAPNYLSERGRVIPGWGLAYTDTILTGPPHADPGQTYQQVTKDEWWTHGDDPDAAWAYVLNDRDLSVLDRAGNGGWLHVGDLPYDEDVDKARLTAIECGANWERCYHIAAAHFNGVDSRMGTRTYLGLEPRGWEDKVAIVRADGQRVTISSSGGTGTAQAHDWRALERNPSAPRYWWASTDGDDVRLARVLKNGGYRLDHDVVLAATRDEPELIVPKGTVLN